MNNPGAIDWSRVTIEDLLASPGKFGLPTFEEYGKNREKWHPSGRDDESMITLTDGPRKFRKDLNKIHFQLHGKQLASEEEVERALGDHGYTLADIDLENRDSKLKKSLNMIPLGGGKYDLVVNFMP